MKPRAGRAVTLLIVLGGLCLVAMKPSIVSGANEFSVAKGFSIGEPGPSALRFKVWTNKDEGESFSPGDRAIIFFTVEKPAYLTVLSLSEQGKVTLLLPNKLMPDSNVQPHKLYALFGDDAPVRLTTGKSTGESQLLLYVTSKPFELEPLAIPKESKWLTIEGGALNDLKALKEKLRLLAEDAEFNQAAIPLPGATGGNMEIRATEVPRQAKKKTLPSTIESDSPEAVTGSAGLKPLRRGNLKQ
jgi:hypothetical protein